ncbi:MAG: hypothetical protein U5R48_14860 [Gammaproteobacteria bacterium]|nr:hypothetical protein [Gammaproteobacteria bacterium]
MLTQSVSLEADNNDDGTGGAVHAAVDANTSGGETLDLDAGDSGAITVTGLLGAGTRLGLVTITNGGVVSLAGTGGVNRICRSRRGWADEHQCRGRHRIDGRHR